MPADSADQVDPVARQRSRDRELRAAVDVMFEALSHIQASLETTSKEKRAQSYRTFKEALYERFEHVVEKREESAVDIAAGGQVRSATQNGHVEKKASDGDFSDESDEDDTLEKLWPEIAA